MGCARDRAQGSRVRRLQRYGRGLAKLKKGDRHGGDADIAAAKAIRADIADDFARYG